MQKLLKKELTLWCIPQVFIYYFFYLLNEINKLKFLGHMNPYRRESVNVIYITYKVRIKNRNKITNFNNV